MLKPRVRIVADEHLTGAPREAVQTRLDLWLKTHIEKLLGPLFELAAAEDVTGIARGIAFQLVEALGVLERQKVAEEVKGLDQPARAVCANTACASAPITSICRRCSSRRRARWRRSCGRSSTSGPKTKGLDAIERLAASGGRSIAADKDVAKRSTAPPAIACAASARCASIFWSGWPT